MAALPQLGPRSRRIARYVGIGLVGLVTFVLTLQATLPFDRARDKLIDAVADKYDLQIGSIEGGWWPGRVYLKAVTVRTRPTTADEVATTFYVEQLRVDLGLFAVLRGAIAVDFDAKIGPGHIIGDANVSKSATIVTVTGDDLPSASLPMREALGLPMSGKLNFTFHLDLPNDKLKTGKTGPDWTKADGSVSLDCPSGCSVGDGKSKLKPKLQNTRNQAFAEGGIDFGKVNIDRLSVAAEIKNSKLSVTKFETKSGDGELHLAFDMTVNQDINQSQVTGCLRFKGSDALLKREPKTHAAISTTGGPLGPDNLFHIKLEGTLQNMRRLGQICTAASPTGSPAPTMTARPNLTITPEPTKPAVAPPPTPPPAVAPPAATGSEAAGAAAPAAPVTEPPQPPQMGPGPVSPAGTFTPPVTTPPSPPPAAPVPAPQPGPPTTP